MVNDSFGTSFDLNSVYATVHGPSHTMPYLKDSEGSRTVTVRIFVETTCPVQEGQEVFVPYGNDYFKDFDAPPLTIAVDDTRAASPSRWLHMQVLVCEWDVLVYIYSGLTVSSVHTVPRVYAPAFFWTRWIGVTMQPHRRKNKNTRRASGSPVFPMPYLWHTIKRYHVSV
jgi:hypothetical protein